MYTEELSIRKEERRDSRPEEPFRATGRGIEPLRETGQVRQPFRETGQVGEPFRETGRVRQPFRATDMPKEPLRETELSEEEREEQERRRRRRKRIEEMKREKRRRELMFRYGVPAMAVAAVLCLFLLTAGILKALRPEEGVASGKGDTLGSAAGDGSLSGSGGTKPEDFVADALSKTLVYTQAGGFSAAVIPSDAASAVVSVLPDAPRQVFQAGTTEHTDGFGGEISSPHGIMIDVGSGEVLAQRDGWSRINPASMTKILTVLVAAEHITDMDGTFTMTIDITDYSFVNDCSNVGFEVGEVIPVEDLFYGTALKSGADAALGLAVYVAGSHEAFVDMMNDKLVELGLSETSHFTNCIGLYDENHYSTPYDMAVILKEAADNEFCRKVLSEHRYVTTSTAEHPGGIDISNLFLRRIEDRDTHGEVLCAKTGYVDQSKNCAASLASDHDGREYICVTAGSDSAWICIRDQVALYQRYLPE